MTRKIYRDGAAFWVDDEVIASRINEGNDTRTADRFGVIVTGPATGRTDRGEEP